MTNERKDERKSKWFWQKKRNVSTSKATTDKLYTPWNWSLKHHQKPLQHGNVTHINACHWNNWQINTGKWWKIGTILPPLQSMNKRADWRLTGLGKKISMVESEWGHYCADTNQRKENTSLFLVNSSDGVCLWRHICAHILTEVSITVFIFVFKGKESALFYKTEAPKKKTQDRWETQQSWWLQNKPDCGKMASNCKLAS